MKAEDQVRELEQALDQCLAWAGKLERRIAELELSRTWRLQRAVAEAGGSVREAVGLPGRLLEILRAEQAAPPPEPLDPPWPTDKPLLSVLRTGAAEAETAGWTLTDVEILPAAGSVDEALAEASGRYCALLPEAPVAPSWFERAVLALESSSSAAVCYEGGAPFEAERLERFNPVPAGAVFRRELFEELGGLRGDVPDPWGDFWLRTARAGHGGLVLGRESSPGSRTFRSSGRFPRGLDFSADKPCVLVLLPWLAYGGAEQVALDLMDGLRGEFSFAVVALEADGNLRRDAFEALTPWVYCLDELGVRDAPGFLKAFAATHGIRGALVSSTGAGYEALPALGGLWRADIVHNVAPEGHLARSIARRSEIETHFAVGEMQRRALEAGGVDPQRIVLAPNGVDALGRFDPHRWAERRPELRAEFGLEPGDFAFAYIARLSPEKRPARFVLALSLLRRMFPEREIRGLLAGDGSERLEVERLLRDEGLRDSVRTLGFTERIPQILAAADAFCLPSSIEGSPLTLLEAMSMGLPVVASNVGAVAEVVAAGETGLLVDDPGAGALADACARLLRELGLAESLGRAARRRVVESFTWERTIHSYREAFLRGIGPTIAK
ncbi:MAG: glycosyltransferase [Acidobacteria bacterium]|nr:glycosyltransferase [Acidobacteriota bacterium]